MSIRVKKLHAYKVRLASQGGYVVETITTSLLLPASTTSLLKIVKICPTSFVEGAKIAFQFTLKWTLRSQFHISQVS